MSGGSHTLWAQRGCLRILSRYVVFNAESALVNMDCGVGAVLKLTKFPGNVTAGAACGKIGLFADSQFYFSLSTVVLFSSPFLK